MKKKLIMAAILVLSAALLVATSVMGTLAFLASSSAVSNTFTYGDVGIDMRESAVDAEGRDIDNQVVGENLRTSDGNSYHLIPNKSYCKDPAIYVDANSVSSYLFVKIKNGISTIEKEGDSNNPTIKEQMVANGWQLIKSNSSTGEELYIYVGTGASSSLVSGKLNSYAAVGGSTDQVIKIFDTFTVEESAVVADYAGAKVTLTAFAIQTEGFTDVNEQPDATTGLYGYQRAWNAIVGRFPYESGTVYAVATNP